MCTHRTEVLGQWQGAVEVVLKHSSAFVKPVEEAASKWRLFDDALSFFKHFPLPNKKVFIKISESYYFTRCCLWPRNYASYLKGSCAFKHLLGPYTANMQTYENYFYILSPQLRVFFKKLMVIKLSRSFWSL
jgi:hypothetical protein